MKTFFYTLFFIFSFSISAWAQLSGERTVPSTDYPDLNSVADSLNLYGVGSGGINFLLQGDSNFEESPIVFTASGSADNTVYIGWDGSGEKPIVNFDGSGLDGDAGLVLNGVDYYTLEGFKIINSNSNLEIGILISNFDDQNGAHNNTVKNMEVTLDKLNAFQTVGMSVIAQVAPIQFDGNNHNNKFYNNHISNVSIGYFFDGNTSTTSFMSVGNEVGIQDGGESLIEDIVMAGVTASDQNGFNFSNNIIRDLTRIGSGTIAPAAIATSSGNPSEPLGNEIVIANNSIENLTSSFTSIFGLYMSARKVTYHINNNKIDNITATGGGANTADGIMVLATDALAYIYNNMISRIAAPSSAVSGNAATRGINVRTFGQAYVFYNSVLLDYEADNAADQSAAFMIYNNNEPVQMRNNIFVNKTILPADATGMVAAFYKRTPAITNIMAGSDDNIYYAGEPGPQNAIFYGHSTTTPSIQETIEDYQAFAVTFDQNSMTEDVPFIADDDLHILSSAVTVAINDAEPINEPIVILTDFDGSIRGPGSTDIGADEVASPLPDVAINPNPADGEMDVIVGSILSWDYLTSPEYSNPQAFLIYLGLSPDFEGPNLLEVVMWEEGVTNYSVSPWETLDSETLYYWQVIPITDLNDGFVPDIDVIWTFTTEVFIFPYPNPAENPSPVNNGTVDLTDDHIITFGWDYNPVSTHSLADHFELYGATDTNSAVWQTPIVVINYESGQLSYELELVDNPNFTYELFINNFWKIVPVAADNQATPNVPVWIFSFDENIGLKELSLEGTLIYPNPADHFVNIEPGFEGKYELMLYDLQGRLVQHFGISEGSRTIDISTVQVGSYQLVIQKGQSRSVSLIKVN